MIHLMPTTRCNLSCQNCCFAEANSMKKQDLPIEEAKNIIEQFYKLGTRALEITGFGDLTCYPYVNELINHASKLGFVIGANSNGHLIKNIKNLNKLKWLRLSMNTLDFYDIDDAYPMDYIRKTAPNLKISGCYVNTSLAKKTIPKVIDFAHNEKMMVRIVPNCIDSKKGIKTQIKQLKKLVPKDDKYVFISDFNINLNDRKNNNCFLHMIKPAIAPDGYVYSCPSSELSVENGTKFNNEFRICKGTDVYSFYTSEEAYKIPQHKCSYCKYINFNNILEDVLTKSDFNEFT